MPAIHIGDYDALTDRLLRRLAELGPTAPCMIVAPSRRMADRLERAAVESGLALFDKRFHTFHSLAHALVAESGGPPRRLVSDPVFHDRLVDSLLEAEPELGERFGGAARPRALAGALRSSLRDLIDAGVEPSLLEEHFGAELLKDEAEAARLSALLRLLTAYEARLERLGVMSSSGLIALAAELAPRSRLLGRLEEILYFGFYDLTGLQLSFFESVVARFPARAFIPYRRAHPAFRFADPFFEEKLLRFPVEEEGATDPRALGGALDGLFAPGVPGAAAPEGALRLLSASGARDELWAVAKEILGLVEEQGYRFDEIGVVARTLEPYRAAAAELFAENGIPCDIAADEPALRQPLAKAALNLLSMRRRDFPAAALEDLVGSPYFIGAAPRQVALYRRLIAHLGIRSGWLQWRKLEGRLGHELELYPESVRNGGRGARIPAEALDGLWTLVAGLEAELRGALPSWAEGAARARALLARTLQPPVPAERSEREAWDCVQRALDELVLFDLLGRAPDWDEFVEAFEDKLRRAAIAAPGRRGVRVLGAMDARGESFRALFLIGLKEKLFPRQVQEDPILREPARAALRHPAGHWIARKASGYEEERLLFYLAAASAREKLICVAPRSDESGKAEVPSLYLRELFRAAGRALTADGDDRVPREPLERLRRCAFTRLTPKEASLRLAASGVAPGPYLDAAGGSGALVDEGLAAAERIGGWGEPDSHDGLIGAPHDFLAELRGRGLSSTALEAYTECPFRFYAARVLGLGEKESLSEKGEFTPQARGTIYHRALERFYAAMDGRLGQDHRPQLARAVEETFAEFGWRELGVYPLLWESGKRVMSAHLESFVRWDLGELKRLGLTPFARERKLEAPLAARLPAGLEGLSLVGVIDRIERDESGRLRVVDYKRRTRKEKLEGLIEKGKLLQLPVYAELVSQTLGAPLLSAHLLAIEDSPETTGLAREQSYAGESWSADRESFLARVSALIEGIAAGRYPIRPADGEHGHCSRCEFPSVCRKGHAPSRARALRAR